MKMNTKLAVRFGLGIIGMVAMTDMVWAQPFAYTNNDLFLGFRKTGSFKESYEVVVNIGKATNYALASAGSSFAVPNFTLLQLSPGSFANLNHLNWSVFGFSKTNLSNVLPGYVNNTLWLTAPRSNPAIQTAPPTRLIYTSQNTVGFQIGAIANNAAYLSSQTTSNQYNTARFIREPVNDPSDLTAYMGDVNSDTNSTLQGSWSQNNLENSTPASFTACLVSDLYEVRPQTDATGHPVTDPHTGQTTGPAYYVGYFQFCPDGTMTFVRASATTAPPAPQLTITTDGTKNLVSFPTANGAVYTLHYTNSAGLTQPVSSWPTSPTTITGDGSVKTFTNSPGGTELFYRVGAQ